eukprot:GILJ01004033.1.p1 GENE.GILJ01004033.1~~GILJ01004033.1.p1  ORF type:complete len:354 (-),score=57.11 GILJ01004033.1:46-1107(-)
MGLTGCKLDVQDFTQWSLQEVIDSQQKFRSLCRQHYFDQQLFHLCIPAASFVSSQRHFHIFDTDFNGKVDAGEVYVGLCLLSAAVWRDKLSFLFSLFDLGRRGFIAADGLRVLLHTVGEALSKIDEAKNVAVLAAVDEQMLVQEAIERYSEDKTSLGQSSFCLWLSELDRSFGVEAKYGKYVPEERDDPITTSSKLESAEIRESLSHNLSSKVSTMERVIGAEMQQMNHLSERILHAKQRMETQQLTEGTVASARQKIDTIETFRRPLMELIKVQQQSLAAHSAALQILLQTAPDNEPKLQKVAGLLTEVQLSQDSYRSQYVEVLQVVTKLFDELQFEYVAPKTQFQRTQTLQ